MANQTTVHITAGIPDGGTGTVSTLDGLAIIGLPLTGGTVALGGGTASISGTVTAVVGGTTNLNQGGAALSSTNGIFANILFNNALVSASVGLPVNIVTYAPLTAVVSGTTFISGGTVTAVVSGTAVISSGTVTANVSGTVTATATLAIGGSVVSSTNGLFSNLTQNNATLTNTNGVWANVMFNNAMVSASVGLPVNIVSGTVSVGNVTAAINQGGSALSSTNGLYMNIIGSTSGGTTVAVKGASITAVAADPSLVVQFNPQSPGIIPTGTFGTPSTTVLSVQGQTSGTPIPVSGTVTAVISGTAVISSGSVTAALNQGGNAISSTNGLFANVMFNNAIVSASVGLPVNIVSGSVSVGNVTAALNQGGNAISSTNGIFSNVMFNNALVSASVGLPVNIISGSVSVGNVTSAINQGGSALSTTNGIFANVMFNNAIVSASVGLPINIVAGSATVTAVVSSGSVTASLNQGGNALSSTNGAFFNILFNNALVSASVGLPVNLVTYVTLTAVVSGTTFISGGTVTAQISGGTSFISGGNVTAIIASGTSFISGGNVTAIIASGTSFISGGNVTAVISGTAVISSGTVTATLNQAGAALSSTNALPVSGPLTLSTTATPTLATTNAYTATQVIGGQITFTGVLGAYTQGIIESITCKFNTGAMTTGLSVALFKASATAGTYTDHVVAAVNTADIPNLIGVYILATAYSSLGNHAIYNLDGIGKAFQSGTSNVYGVVTSLGTTLALGNLTTFSIELAVLPG